MPKPTYLNIAPVARDPDGVAEAQVLATAGAVVLNGTQADAGTAGQWDVGDSYPTGIGGARMRILGASEGVNFTFTGKDYTKASRTEVVAGAAGSPATDTNTYWSQITSIVGSGQHHSFIIGPAHGVMSKPVPLNWRGYGEAATYTIFDPESSSGDIAGTIDEYFGPFQEGGFVTDGWITKHTMAENTPVATDGTSHARAVRVSLATQGASFQFGVLQN